MSAGAGVVIVKCNVGCPLSRLNAYTHDHTKCQGLNLQATKQLI
jgi:hypothetical protein